MIHNKHDKLLIVGAGGHGKVCIDVAEQMNLWEEIKLIDDHQTGFVLEKEIIGTTELIDTRLTKEYDFFVGIGDNQIRKNIFEKILKQKGNIVNLISRHSIISKYVEIGFGNLFMPLCVVNTDAKIGTGNIINTSVIVEHDVIIGDYNHLSPGSQVLGGACLENLNWLGASSLLFPGVSIESEIVLGAHSMIRESLQDSGLVIVGNSRRIS